MRVSHAAGIFTLLLCATAAQAKDRWHLNGFISQYGIYSSDNFMMGPSDDNLSLDYRELALIVHGGVTEQINFSSQLLSRKAGVSEDGTPKIDYGFFNWRYYDSTRFMHSVTVGRIKAPIGLYNDLRESPFTRNGVFLPQSIYLDRIRNSLMSADEILLTDEFRHQDWSFNFAGGAGTSQPDKNEAMDNFDVQSAEWDLHLERSRRWNIRLLADYQEGRLRFAATRYFIPVKFAALFSVTPTLVIPINGEVRGLWDVLSLEYNTENYSITSEVYRGTVKYSGVEVDPSNPDYSNKPQGGYLQFTSHLNDQYDCYVRYDSTVFDREDANGKHYSRLIPYVPSFSRFATGYAAGLAYRPTPNWLLRFDVHSIDGSMWMTKRDAPEDYVPKRHWHMIATSISWRF